jgi:hypothetical protein
MDIETEDVGIRRGLPQLAADAFVEVSDWLRNGSGLTSQVVDQGGSNH